jgi:regulator of protease activity HflC (stomatin/prohibitin superfamily)
VHSLEHRAFGAGRDIRTRTVSAEKQETITRDSVTRGLRNIIGQHDLDEVLQERNKINTLLRESIAGSTTA